MVAERSPDRDFRASVRRCRDKEWHVCHERRRQRAYALDERVGFGPNRSCAAPCLAAGPLTLSTDLR
jgi:hypothetical protein